MGESRIPVLCPQLCRGIWCTLTEKGSSVALLPQAHTTAPLGPADPSSAGAGLEEAWLRHTSLQWISDPDVQLCCQQPSSLPIAQLPREDQEEGGHGATWQCGVQRDAGGGWMLSPGAVHPAGASLPSHIRTCRPQAACSWPVSTTALTPWPADHASTPQMQEDCCVQPHI